MSVYDEDPDTSLPRENRPLPGSHLLEGGHFKDPECAAAHAILFQGGSTTPEREAARMIRDGGASEHRARAWMARKGLTDDDLDWSR